MNLKSLISFITHFEMHAAVALLKEESESFPAARPQKVQSA
jgi:hypothetical protein